MPGGTCEYGGSVRGSGEGVRQSGAGQDDPGRATGHQRNAASGQQHCGRKNFGRYPASGDSEQQHFPAGQGRPRQAAANP